MIGPDEALERLRAGNQRFVAGNTSRCTSVAPSPQVAAGQEPFAAVLGCADSRVPVELAFDQAIGELFVVRVAGNIAAATQVGSLEFAAENFGTRLIVVLGHSSCGAVKATLDGLAQGSRPDSPHLNAIVERVAPAVEPLLQADPSTRVRDAVRANVRATVAELKRDSASLAGLVQNSGLRIVGAEYALDTGVVEFLDD